MVLSFILYLDFQTTFGYCFGDTSSGKIFKMKSTLLPQVIFVTLLVFVNVINSEPPRSSNNNGWGQQQSSGGYAQPSSGGYAPQSSGGYSSGGAASSNGGGWGSGGQQQAQVQSGGGWGNGGQQQAQVQSGGWGNQQSQQSNSGGGGWGNQQSQQQSNSGGWGGQLNVELDTANLNLKNLNPRELFRSIIGIPRRIIKFFRESGLYMLFIPLLIILPLMLLAFNAGRLIGGSGWGWGRSMNIADSGIIGYFKSPAWQKVAETLMDEKVFDRIMKSLDEFKKDW